MAPELVERMFDNQAEELQLRREELACQEREGQRAHDYALKSLQAQATDRHEARIAGTGIMTRTYIFLFLCLVVVIAAGAWALSLGKDQLVLEVTRLIIAFASGGAAGYGARRAKKEKQEVEEDE